MEVVKALISKFERRDVDGVIESLDPAIEWQVEGVLFCFFSFFFFLFFSSFEL